MDNSRLPKRLFYGELMSGRRCRGRPKKRYKDNLKEALKLCQIPHTTWEVTAGDRSLWRARTKAEVAKYEKRRISEKEERRQARKGHTDSPPKAGPAPRFACPHCDRLFLARIGLFSHLRSHPAPPR